METERVRGAARRYFERMLGLPLNTGNMARYSAAIANGCPPFLLGCAVIELQSSEGIVRAAALNQDEALLSMPIAAIKGRRTDYIALIPTRLPPEPLHAVPIPPDAIVSGRPRIPNPDCAFGIPVSGRFVSWASAADFTEIWNVTVETAPTHRGKGYAAQALAALTHHLLERGKPPLYICEIGNTASIRTALATEYAEYVRFTRIHITNHSL